MAWKPAHRIPGQSINSIASVRQITPIAFSMTDTTLRRVKAPASNGRSSVTHVNSKKEAQDGLSIRRMERR
jgi:hypothetical protein